MEKEDSCSKARELVKGLNALIIICSLKKNHKLLYVTKHEMPMLLQMQT